MTKVEEVAKLMYEQAYPSLSHAPWEKSPFKVGWRYRAMAIIELIEPAHPEVCPECGSPVDPETGLALYHFDATVPIEEGRELVTVLDEYYIVAPGVSGAWYVSRRADHKFLAGPFIYKRSAWEWIRNQHNEKEE